MTDGHTGGLTPSERKAKWSSLSIECVGYCLPLGRHRVPPGTRGRPDRTSTSMSRQDLLVLCMGEQERTFVFEQWDLRRKRVGLARQNGWDVPITSVGQRDERVVHGGRTGGGRGRARSRGALMLRASDIFKMTKQAA